MNLYMHGPTWIPESTRRDMSIFFSIPLDAQSRKQDTDKGFTQALLVGKRGKIYPSFQREYILEAFILFKCNRGFSKDHRGILTRCYMNTVIKLSQAQSDRVNRSNQDFCRRLVPSNCIFYKYVETEMPAKDSLLKRSLLTTWLTTYQKKQPQWITRGFNWSSYS